MSPLAPLLWGVLPYVTIAVLVGGTIWRYRYDKFGWTTRSSELYEARLLRIGSPLFHFGILVALRGADLLEQKPRILRSRHARLRRAEETSTERWHDP